MFSDHRRALVRVVAGVIALGLGACSGGDDGKDARPADDAASSTTTRPGADTTVEPDALVRASFDAYRSALLDGDGPVAAATVTQGTIAYFADMQNLAAGGGPEEIGARPMIDRLFVTLVRQRVERQQLLALSGTELLIYGVEEGLVAQDTVAAVMLGDVEIDGETADAAVINRGQPTSGRFRFARESGAWKVDLVFLLRAAEAPLRQAAANAGQDENRFIFERVAATTGMPVPPDVWRRPAP